MSSILKALEKVEESQSGRRSGGAAGFVKSRERRAPWVLPVAVLGGAVVAGLATFAAMGGFSRHHGSAPQAPLAAVSAQPVSAARGTLPVPAQQSQKVSTHGAKAVLAASVASPGKGAAANAGKSGTSAKRAAKDSDKREPKSEKALKKERRERAARERERERERERSARRARREREREGRSQSVAEQVRAVLPPVVAPAAVAAAHPAEKPHASHAAIRVTGIAFQKDGASSLAMVNGRSVQQGATVEGYKVEQIFEDKVRFSGTNGKLEVPLGAGE
jgi:general secretion pathway protein B